MEFAVEMCFMYVGARMGYGSGAFALVFHSRREGELNPRHLDWSPPPAVKTLTDASVRNCLGDLRALQPTILVGVPAVWETIRKGIVSKVKASGAVKSKVFDLGMAAKRFGGRGSFLGNLADKVVFEAVKQGTGGKLKYALSGGAPISKETQEFLSIALVLIIQGFAALSLFPSTSEVLADELCCLSRSYGMTESTACAPLPAGLNPSLCVDAP